VPLSRLRLRAWSWTGAPSWSQLLNSNTKLPTRSCFVGRKPPVQQGGKLILGRSKILPLFLFTLLFGFSKSQTMSTLTKYVEKVSIFHI
jgi:hypothetical protein